MEIRDALGTDAEAIAGLYAVLCPGEPVCVLPWRIEEIRRDPNSHLLVLAEDGEVRATGFVTLCLDPMFGSQPYAVVENVVVAPTARGRGLGSALLGRIEGICVEARCSKIMLLSNAQRTRAHAFFAHQGYRGDISRAFKKYLGAHGPSRVSEGG